MQILVCACAFSLVSAISKCTSHLYEAYNLISVVNMMALLPRNKISDLFTHHADLCLRILAILKKCVFWFKRLLPFYLLAQFWCIHVCFISPFVCFNVKPRLWFRPFLVAVFISFSVSRIIQTLSFFGAACWRVRRRQKIASLLCRSEGFCCDKSDRVTEQLSGLLTDYLSVMWLGDGLICGQLNDWLVFRVPDRLIDCLLCWLDVNMTDFLSTCL